MEASPQYPVLGPMGDDDPFECIDNRRIFTLHVDIEPLVRTCLKCFIQGCHSDALVPEGLGYTSILGKGETGIQLLQFGQGVILHPA